MSDTNQKDLVLSINEFSYVLDETKGHVSCLVGPTKMSLSQSDKLVRFNTTTKAFEPCSYDAAKYLFTIVPESWYCVLKNPIKDNKHPTPGASNTLPENMLVGQKINVRGPASFALYPGQMAKVIRGHALRTNQYLLARVYDAEAANTSQGDIRDAEGNVIQMIDKYTNGQILVIKGTEVSFYIPPTGIEVMPIKNDSSNGYIREAVTLERLEYCILKDEDGNKTYKYGPEVVFPKPSESFVTSPKGGYVFRAIELSKITGIYVKVIAEYKDDDGTVHPVGEELFITGDQQMIYYPRPEHAVINYDEKITHHAIAIPEGEGRYIMNRLTGEIKTVYGPAMYLPDPRTEVVVKRKLTPKQCSLWYPGNKEALNYNNALTERAVEKNLGKMTADIDCLNSAFTYATANLASTLASLETNASISRGTSYTKPRTITLDNKFDGVVSIDVWTGYAVNVISKSGERKVVCGPQTILLDYDQTLEELQMSTGKPKSTDNVIHTVYLRHKNNKVSDIIEVETKDFVRCAVKVSYCVDFEDAYSSKWFNVENYVKFLSDRVRAEVRSIAKKYNIEAFYQNYAEIVRNAAVIPELAGPADVARPGRFFEENGMNLYECEVLGIKVESDIEELLEEHQREMITQSLRLADAEKRISVIEKLANAEQKEKELKSQQLINKMELEREEAVRRSEIQSEINRRNEAEKEASKKAEQDLQNIMDAIYDANLDRERRKKNMELDYAREMATIEKAKQDAYAATISRIMSAVAPELVAAMTSNANADLTKAIAESLSPYALAGENETTADVVDQLMRGTPMKDFLTGLRSE